MEQNVNKIKEINSISHKFSKSEFVHSIFRQQKIKYVLLIVMLMRLDIMCFCTLSLKPRDLRRLIKDSEEDPIVLTALIERFINLICLLFGSRVCCRG